MAEAKLNDRSTDRFRCFNDFIENGKDKKCLQIGVRDQRYAPHWVTVDLFDTSELIDFNYDVQNLEFSDQSFDRVACVAILEHVENPFKAVAELHRILKPGGQIWVELPMNQPYHPHPQDYWRFTPEGIRRLLQGFAEVDCGYFRINRSVIYNGVFFHGRKT